MTQKLVLPKISHTMVMVNNLISQRRCVAQLPLFEGAASEVRLRTVSFSAMTGGLVISIKCQGHLLDVVVDETSAERLLGDIDNASELPRELLLALIQQLMNDAIEQLEACLLTTLDIVDVQLRYTASSQMTCLTLPIEVADERLRVDWFLVFDNAFAAWLAEKLKMIPLSPANNWSDLPVSLDIVVGSTELTLYQLRQLSINDIVLLDRCYSQQQQLSLCVDQTTAFLAQVDKTKLTLLTTMERTMNTVSANEYEHNHESADQDDIATAMNVEQLNVTLEFHLGALNMTLGQLRTLSPGYVFDLNLDLTAPVAVKAKGTTIGRCALVDIEHRVGAQLTELFGAAKKPNDSGE